jgi:hypothetical protein
MSSSLAQPPVVTVIVLFVSISMSFASSFINSRFMPREHRQKVAALNRKISQLRKEIQETSSKDSETRKTSSSTSIPSSFVVLKTIQSSSYYDGTFPCCLAFVNRKCSRLQIIYQSFYRS